MAQSGPPEAYDTDVLIDHLQGTRTLPVGDDLAYSCVSRAELYSWAAADEDRIDAFLDPLDEIVLDREVAEQAGRLLRSGVDLADRLASSRVVVGGCRRLR